MKKMKKLLGLSIAAIALAVTAVACDEHKHAWGDWSSNGDGTHTHVCTEDTAHTETKACHGGTATCTDLAVCVDCGAEYGDTLVHVFTKKDTAEKYMKSEATCQSPATYYYSCVSCGTKGTETFTEGVASTEHTYNQKVAEDKFIKSEADCVNKAVYYQSCVCGEFVTGDEAATFAYGEVTGHDFTDEIPTSDYLYTEATCSAQAVYHKACSVCGAAATEAEDVFSHGDLAEHSYTADVVDKKYEASPDGYYYYSCSMCGNAGSTTFNGYVNQDDSWNIVSKAFLSDATDAEGLQATARPSVTTDAAGTKFVSATEDDRVTVVRLDEVQDGVGGKTTGIYYKVKTTGQNNTKFGFTVMPSHTKAEYEAFVAENPTAALSFEVYFDPVGGWVQTNGGATNRQIFLNALAYAPQNAEVRVWHTLSIPLETILANWDKLGDTLGSYTNADYRYVALFNYANGYQSMYDESGCFYIGNFSIAGFNKTEGDTPDVTPTGSVWNAVDASLITSDKDTSDVKYYNYQTAGQPDYEDRITVVTLSADNAVGGRTEGDYYKVESDVTNTDRAPGIAVMPLWDWTYFEQFIAEEGNENATLKFDVLIQPVGGYAPTTGAQNRLYVVNGQSGNRQMETGKWTTLEVKLSTLIANKANYGATTASSNMGDYRQRVLFAYLMGYNSQYDQEGSCFYIGNFQIEGFLEYYAEA